MHPLRLGPKLVGCFSGVVPLGILVGACGSHVFQAYKSSTEAIEAVHSESPDKSKMAEIRTQVVYAQLVTCATSQPFARVTASIEGALGPPTSKSRSPGLLAGINSSQEVDERVRSITRGNDFLYAYFLPTSAQSASKLNL